MNAVVSKSCFVSLPDRGLVCVTGPDATQFLQGLVTQDLQQLALQPVVLSCFLSPQGKYLHDFFVTHENETYFLWCEGGDRAQDLAKRLSIYKLRAQVTITAEPRLATYLLFPEAVPSRHKPEDRPEISFSDWNTARIQHATAFGSWDAELGQSTLAELNMDQTHVSYTKGCYMGQELVARMHNRNLGKKHLVAVQFSGPPLASGQDVVLDGQVLGIMRSCSEQFGLVLMTFDNEQFLKSREKSDDQIRLLG